MSETTQFPDVLHTLTDRQLQYAQYYALYRSKYKAAQLAQYKVDRNSHSIISQHLDHVPGMAEAIAYYQAVLGTHRFYTAEKIIQDWADKASFKITQLLNDDWTVKNINELEPDVAEHLSKALVGIEVVHKKDSRPTIKPQFAIVQALQELGKIRGVYKDAEHGKEGMVLNVILGQSVTTGEGAAGQVETLGHLNLRVGEDGTG